MTEQHQDQYPPQAPPVNERGVAYDPDATSDERTFALFMHLGLLGHLVISVLAILIPIIMWSMKKEESPFLDDHGREAINFQISLMLISLLLIPVGFLTCGAAFFLYIPLYVLAIIGMIQAAIAANRGEFYRYPMTMRFLH
jgi:uncharacterized protein